jgi:hypothetical protein
MTAMLEREDRRPLSLLKIAAFSNVPLCLDDLCVSQSILVSTIFIALSSWFTEPAIDLLERHFVLFSINKVPQHVEQNV